MSLGVGDQESKQWEWAFWTSVLEIGGPQFSGMSFYQTRVAPLLFARGLHAASLLY
jgi:hypothetical protein